MKKFIIVAMFALVPFVASAHTRIISCDVPVIQTGGGLLAGSGPMAYGWKASEHPNYVPYNGTTCPFSQGCMLPK